MCIHTVSTHDESIHNRLNSRDSQTANTSDTLTAASSIAEVRFPERNTVNTVSNCNMEPGSLSSNADLSRTQMPLSLISCAKVDSTGYEFSKEAMCCVGM